MVSETHTFSLDPISSNARHAAYPGDDELSCSISNLSEQNTTS